MTSQSPGVIKSDSDQISTDDGEDKKFVSQAVAFVIGHARNGFVSLCASVASLLKEQSRLKQENDSLQQEISYLKTNSSRHNKLYKESHHTEVNISVKKLSSYKNESINNTEKIPKSAMLIKLSKQLPYKKIMGCICSLCCANKIDFPLTAPLEKGMKVIIRGELCGSVEYVGHVETLNFPEIHVGIKFNEAVGDSDGSIHKKVYFSVPKNHGMFVPLPYVCCVIR